MGIWIKFFEDRTRERGSDKDISNGQASWSKGKLDNIRCVQLFEKNLCCALTVPNTEWHQYDRYMASMGAVDCTIKQSFRSARVIQAKITPEHVGKSISCVSSTGVFLAELTCDAKDATLIKEENVGLWITLYILANGQAGMKFCEKGAFYGDKEILK